MSAAVAATAVHKHQRPLEEDLLAIAPLKTKSKKRKAKRDEEDDHGYVDSKASRKILKIGQDLQEEDRDESRTAHPNNAFAFESRFTDTSDLDEETKYGDDEPWGDEVEDATEEAEVDANDLDLFNKFIPSGEDPTLDFKASTTTNEEQGTNLADLILEQIAAYESTKLDQPEVLGGGPPEEAVEIPAKVVEVYTKVGWILSRYKSGKLPKPLKILPSLPQWEDLLSITRPDSWTPNACYEATRIFISSNPKVARSFVEMILLDRVREDIKESRKLNTHLFKSLKKATYKPAAFFKGFLFPLVESGTCTLREAHIISGVISQTSIPVLHSAAALMYLTNIAAEQASMSTEGGGATNIFIRTLLEKKYALPYQVIDNLVFHFLRFRAAVPAATTSKDLKLPVLWHLSLLTFSQRYRNDITEDQREALLDLLVLRGHKDIGPEVRRELLAGRGRGVPILPEGASDGGDDTMVMEVA